MIRFANDFSLEISYFDLTRSGSGKLVAENFKLLRIYGLISLLDQDIIHFDEFPVLVMLLWSRYIE